MRFTVEGEGGFWLALRTARDRQRAGDWLTSVEGWDGTPAPREGAQEAAGRDGDMWPAMITQGARIVTLGGLAVRESSVGAQRLADELCALVGQRLVVTGEGPRGRRRAAGFLADDPAPRFVKGGRGVAFGLVVCCPDPLRYGDPARFDARDGRCAVLNEGTAGSWPVVEASGPLTYLSLSLGGRTVSWSGSADSLRLDFADMEPSSGAVTRDEAFRVPPGRSRIGVSCNEGASVSLTVAPAWR